MTNQNTLAVIDTRKKIIILILYVGAFLIIFLGMFFSAFSVLNDISFKVLKTSIHGLLFGLLVTYLGLKYYFMVTNFKSELYKSSSTFSWNNFKKDKVKLNKKMK